MKVTVFAKKKQTKEGRPFTAYVGRMTKKDGTEQAMSVKFKDCEPPVVCPCNLEFDKQNGNISITSYPTEDGKIGESRTLWLSAWMKGEPYVDHSLDDFED